MTSITRRYRFAASHRLHSRELTDAENHRLYGKCNNPYGHGHDYVLEVTASGAVDPLTGRILHIATFDQLIEEKILSRFANCNLNLDLPEFAAQVPTTENVALSIAHLLGQHWPTYFPGGSVRLARVHIQETDRNGFEVLIPAPSPLVSEPEMQHLHD